MNAEKKVVVFCSSSYTIDPIYNQAAREFVRAACLKGYGIVSGGTIKGTMGVVSKTAEECGAFHKGVLPHFMEDVKYPNLSEVVWTETMSERKEEMRKETSASVALPGGIGTMDELMETAVLVKVKKYSGKIFALNIEGFYEPLKALLDSFVQTRMMTPEERDFILFPDTVEELITLLEDES